MIYKQLGIPESMVERVKFKMKNKAIKNRVKKVLEPLTKADLQNSATIRRTLHRVLKILGERLDPQQEANIVHFIISQKIDPQNTFHLLRLWSMFR